MSALFSCSLGKSEKVWVFLNSSHGENDSETCLLERMSILQKVIKSVQYVHERGNYRKGRMGTKGSQRMSISNHNEH